MGAKATKETKYSSPLMQIHKACFWVKREMENYNCPNVYAILDMAVHKFEVHFVDLNHCFQKMYPELHPIQESKEGDELLLENIVMKLFTEGPSFTRRVSSKGKSLLKK